MKAFLFEDVSYATVGVVISFVTISTLWWMLHDWNHKVDSGSGPLDEAPEHRAFTLIVPARHEENVLDETLFRLRHLNYPSVEVLVVAGHDDVPTAEVARSAMATWGARFRVVVDENWPKSKPKALNTALPYCNGDYIGIFDAEDEVSPELLSVVARTFANTGAGIVQSGVQLVDIRSRWYSVRNCLEYYFWYRSRMHAHSLHGVMPLGGNTVFFRRELVEEIGGWDDACLAEDADIGIRLSVLGVSTAVVFDPHVATREETPPTLRSFFKQRTRWNQGFLQVLRKGDLANYGTRRQRLLARYLLSFPLLQATSALLLPISLLMIAFAKLPVGVTLVAFLPLLTTVITTAVELVALGEMCRDFYLRLRWRTRLMLVISTVPFQLVLSLAAFRAVARELRGVRSWEKTVHTGSHRQFAVERANAA